MILGVAVLSICLSICHTDTQTDGLITILRPGSGAEYCDQFVCLSVCVFVCPREIPCVRGSVLLRRRCATLCTSVLMDDVTVGRNGPYVDAWKAEPTTCSGVAISGRSLMCMNALLLFVQYSIQTFGLAVFQPRLNFSPKLTEAATKTKILEY